MDVPVPALQHGMEQVNDAMVLLIPFVHLAGITTGKWARKLEPEGPTLMSWALQNHWMVNFKASQGGETPQRYRLTSHAGVCDDVAATRFGAEVAMPPVVLRDYLQSGDLTECFLEVSEETGALLTAKPAEDGDGVIVRLQNLRATPQTVSVRFPARAPRAAILVSPAEVNGEMLRVVDGAIAVPTAPLAIQSVRIRF